MFDVTIQRPEGLTSDQWEKIAEQIPQLLARATPVRTGHLKASWDEPNISSDSVHVTNSADYAKYAANDVQDEVQSEVEDMLRDFLDR